MARPAAGTARAERPVPGDEGVQPVRRRERMTRADVMSRAGWVKERCADTTGDLLGG
jgi:hypothetical protein